MSEAIRSRIQYYTQRGEAILDLQTQLKVKQPQEELARGIAREGIPTLFGEIATEIVRAPFAGRVVKKLTRSMLNRQEREEQERLEGVLQSSYQAWYGEVTSFLSSISVQKPSLRLSGNSHILLRKFAGTRRFLKAETKIRHGLAVLEETSHEPLLYNVDVPELLQKKLEAKQEDMYLTLKTLELRLRGLIQSKLSSISVNWWKERVPKDVRERAEDRKAKNERIYLWHTERALHPIFYVGFSDYAKIILRKDNWEQAFAPLFKDREIISAKLRELEPIRNAVAHFREIKPSDVQKLKLYSKEILFLAHLTISDQKQVSP